MVYLQLLALITCWSQIVSLSGLVTYDDIQRERQKVIEKLLQTDPTLKGSHFSPLQPRGSQVVNVTEEELMLETHVFIHVTVTRIENVDADSQTITFSAYRILVWLDESLTWNGTAGLYSFEVDPKVVWTPELAEESVIDTVTMMDKVLANYTGVMMQLTQKKYTVPCTVHILEFPFDSHVCHFNISAPYSWLRRIKLHDSHDLKTFVHALEHLQWKLVGISSSVEDDGVEVIYSLKLEVQRKATFFTIVLLLPSVFLNTMSILAFLLPAKEGGRVDFSVNVMVSHYIFLLIMMDSLPPTGGSLPLLGIYILGSNGIVVFIVIMSLLMMKLASYIDNQNDLPNVVEYLCRLNGKAQKGRNKDTFKNNTNKNLTEGDRMNVRNYHTVDELINFLNKITIIITLTSHVLLVSVIVVYLVTHKKASSNTA